jgi:FtsH-binding integral membrane protein
MFIQKVMNILTIQLFFTFGLTALCVLNDSVKTWVQSHPAIIFIAGIFALVIMIVLVCNHNLARKAPINYVLLALITGCMGLLVATVASYYQARSVVYATGITGLISVALSLFACQTKYDFTAKGGYLMAGLFSLIGFGLVLGIVCGAGECEVAKTVYAGLGAFIFSMYIIYDVQLIVGGNHKYSYDEQDYVLAALSLYLDIINLFMYLLQLFGERE